MYKYTKQQITEMADRCYKRCWHCDRYEPYSGYGSTGGGSLFKYASSGCYEAHDLPWESGHWCPFWGNKHHPDAQRLRMLTWDNVASIIPATKLVRPYELRNSILAANPDIAECVKYCDNSNDNRDQYFNKSENQAILQFDKFDVYCETLRRYRFSRVDNKLLYPGANEWLRPMVICYDKETYKSIGHIVSDGDGVQISFACSPDKNYHIDENIFFFDEEKKEIVAEFRTGEKIIYRRCLSIKNKMR